MADAVVKRAPPREGWVFLALKPKAGFPRRATWNDFAVDIAEVTFKPLPLGGNKLGLRLFIPRLRPEDADDAHNALLRALDLALGERDLPRRSRGRKWRRNPAGWAPPASSR